MSGFNFACTFDLQDCIKALGLEERGRVQRRVDSEFLKGVEAYVPKDTGLLIDSGIRGTEIGSGEIVYNCENKARRLYYGEEDWNWSNGGVQEGGLRGPYWAERYFQNGGRQELEAVAREEIKK